MVRKTRAHGAVRRRPAASARRTVLDSEGVERALRRMAAEVTEREVAGGRRVHDLVLVGIREGGVPLVARIAEAVAASEGMAPQVGTIDIALYRDDIGHLSDPIVGSSDIPCALDGKTLVLVDDVLFTGRTVRAAIDALMEFGRPKVIRLAVLIDRGHRELPIAADFVGCRVATDRGENVLVSREGVVVE